MTLKWDYYIKDYKFFEHDFDHGFPNDVEINDLKYLGSKGWELINIVFYSDEDSQRFVRYYFKKQIVN